MSYHKSNAFLDVESSDGEGSQSGYDSENFQQSKGSKRKQVAVPESRSKRRRLSGSQTDRSEDEEDIAQYQTAENILTTIAPSSATNVPTATSTTSRSPSPPNTSTQLKVATTKHEKRRKNKTGVIYMSSLPPYLKPSALKSMLTARGFGPVTKLFLSPDVPPAGSSRTTSSKPNSNKRRMYTDGWVEFASKRTAKICAETLNATIVGGKKGGWYHDDVWNMKYLRGFKWADLMEQVQREKREAEARRRIEDSKARKEEKSFLLGLEQGKAFEGIKRKREEKGKEKSKSETAGDGDKIDVRRVFRQNVVMGSANDSSTAVGNGNSGKKVAADVHRVLSKIF
ncbi:RNA-binding ATPase activator esf2 [Myotisia sp. PD_48]|nr:RNA-binding ATPase activator esf2 [Myotisia sp. PD_48]